MAPRVRNPERSVLLELTIAGAIVNQLFVQELDRLGLRRAHVGILRLIHIHGPITPTALAYESGQAGSTLRNWIQWLVEEGLVVRVPNEADRRSHFLDSTPAGDEFLAAAIPATRAIEELLEHELGESLEDYREPVERLRRATQAALLEQPALSVN